ncbi:MAG: hypothetical protein CL493_03135 [Actinobacteria bacterium]|nr:hypothetical protein [Actinomycetota bacterium]
MLKLILFLQIILLTLFIGTGYFLYSELQTLSSEVDNALVVITDIQNLLPKLEVAIDSVITLEAAFQSLSGLSDILSILIDPLQGNS